MNAGHRTTLRDRMETDPTFRALVYSFYSMFENHCGSGAGITPSEIREASGYAWQMYIERHALPIMVVHPDQGWEWHVNPHSTRGRSDER